MNTIVNGNTKTDQKIYDSFNQFIFSDDIKILGKLLYRFKFFEQTKDLPGDIVELGTFKGSGVATFSKFINIFCPNSNKKILGFDIFDPCTAKDVLKTYSSLDEKNMTDVYRRSDDTDLCLTSVMNNLKNASHFQLIQGDVSKSIPDYLNQNPGFRISLLYMDMDLETPTYEALKHLWNRIIPGGVIVFDEYEYHTFSESNGVDKFLKEFDIPYEITSTNFMAPTAFLVKKK